MTPTLPRQFVINVGAILFSLLISSFPVASQKKKTVTINSGPLKPEEFLALSKDGQAAYAMGFVDGVFLAPYFEARDNAPLFIEFKACIQEKSGSQIAAIIEKKIKSQPEQGIHQLNMLAFDAVISACATP